MYLWFITNGPAGKGADIPGDVIREMAAELALDHRFEVSSDFKFGNGWFDEFKKGYNIKEYTRHGEGLSSDVAAIDSGRETTSRIVSQYPRHRVYNMDETAKRYNMRPTRTLAMSRLGGSSSLKNI